MEEEFDRFWAIYPRKLAKGDARKAWQQTAKIRPALNALLKAVYAAKASEQWMKEGGSFIPYPATWLRQERWEDIHTIDLQNLGSPTGKVCAYCGNPSSGSVGGIYACAVHWDDAMDRKPTNVVMLKAVSA